MLESQIALGRDSLGLNEDVCNGGVQNKFTDKLLRDWDGGLVGHTQIRQIIQESDRADQTGMNNVQQVYRKQAAVRRNCNTPTSWRVRLHKNEK